MWRSTRHRQTRTTRWRRRWRRREKKRAESLAMTRKGLEVLEREAMPSDPSAAVEGSITRPGSTIDSVRTRLKRRTARTAHGPNGAQPERTARTAHSPDVARPRRQERTARTALAAEPRNERHNGTRNDDKGGRAAALPPGPPSVAFADGAVQGTAPLPLGSASLGLCVVRACAVGPCVVRPSRPSGPLAFSTAVNLLPL